MKLGICADLSNAALVEGAGFDYIEGGLSGVAAADDAAFEAMRRAIGSLKLKAEAMNVMIPGSYRLTGPDADHAAAEKYLRLAFGRASLLGVKVQVFGSGGARNVPDGWPMDRAFEQLVSFLKMAGRLAAGQGISIAVEPLRPQECNIINKVSEGLELARRVALPNVGVLADWYHMAEQNEGVEGMLDAKEMLLHCHIATPAGRRFPLKGDGADFTAFFDALKSIGYTGRVSVEGSGNTDEYSKTLSCLREYV